MTLNIILGTCAGPLAQVNLGNVIRTHISCADSFVSNVQCSLSTDIMPFMVHVIAGQKLEASFQGKCIQCYINYPPTVRIEKR